MITVSSFFGGREWRLSLKGWSSCISRNVWFAAGGMSVSMKEPERSVAKVAGKNGMNICLFGSDCLMTRLISRKDTSVIPLVRAGITAHGMSRNMITSPISENSLSRADTSYRFAGRNRNSIFFSMGRTVHLNI